MRESTIFLYELQSFLKKLVKQIKNYIKQKHANKIKMINKYLLRFFSLHFGCEKCKIKRENNENKIKLGCWGMSKKYRFRKNDRQTNRQF